MKHDQRSSALQDTEWVSARNADKRSPVLLESWQRGALLIQELCRLKHSQGRPADIEALQSAWAVTTCCVRTRPLRWAVARFVCQAPGRNRGAQTIQAISPLQTSLSVKRSWPVLPGQSVISFHVWLVPHCSKPATLGGFLSDTGFNHIKSVFARHSKPKESWLFTKAAALATSLGDLPVCRAHWDSDEDCEGLSSGSWEHIQGITDLSCPAMAGKVVLSYQYIYSSLSQICEIHVHLSWTRK